MKPPEAPLYKDPIHDGAADPTLIFCRDEQQWWMVYTQRCAGLPGPGVSSVHGSDLGVASSPDGHRWLYRGTLRGLEFEPGRNTWWAPEIIFHENQYHMYASYVQGMPTDWQRPRRILHYRSQNLWDWQLESCLDLQSDRVIDACLAQVEKDVWRMWYKDEEDHSYVHFADSSDLHHWQPQGRAIDMDAHEGPNVFRLAGSYWYLGDFWRGLGLFKSSDAREWSFQHYLLDQPGQRPQDEAIGHHADVVVQDGRAYAFYFTHPFKKDAARQSRTAIQVARLTPRGKTLVCDRDEAFDFVLKPPQHSDWTG